MTQAWQEKKRPPRLEARYEFSSYDALRDFLDEAAELSESLGLYPDMGFGRDYVNMTIYADEGSEEITAAQHALAEQIEVLRNSSGKA